MTSQFNYEQASYADLLSHAKSIEAQLTHAQVAVQNLSASRRIVADIIKELIEDDTITDNGTISELAKNLNLEIMRSVTFTVTFSVSGEVEIPLGSDLDEYSFELDGVTYNGDQITLHEESCTIESWDFSE